MKVRDSRIDRATAYLAGWLEAGGEAVEGICNAAVMAANTGGYLREVHVPKTQLLEVAGYEIEGDSDGLYTVLATPAGWVKVRIGETHVEPHPGSRVK